MPFSFSKFKNAPNKWHIYRKIIKRFLLLFIFGMIVQGNLLGLNPDSLYLYSNTLQEQIERLRGQGKDRTVETYQSALNSFIKFRDGIDLCFDEMDADLMEHYETEMRSTHHISRNTTSFYMRIFFDSLRGP